MTRIERKPTTALHKRGKGIGAPARVVSLVAPNFAKSTVKYVDASSFPSSRIAVEHFNLDVEWYRHLIPRERCPMDGFAHGLYQQIGSDLCSIKPVPRAAEVI